MNNLKKDFNMLSANEMAIDLFNSAIKQTMYLSDDLKKDQAKDLVLNQLTVAKKILYQSVLIEEKYTGIRKTLDYLETVKQIIEKL